MGVADAWAAYQLDSAVAYFGNKIESAIQEMVKVGTQKAPRWEPKYTEKQLLSDDFKFPKPPDAKTRERESLRRFAAAIGAGTVIRG